MNNQTFTEDEVLDMVHAEIASRPQILLEPVHTFTKGMYSRELFMPAGMEIISEWHDTQHQWVITTGIVDVYLKGQGWTRITGPARGITEPDTRRVLRTITNTLWITFHPTDRMPEDNTPEAVEACALLVKNDILRVHNNPYLGENKKQEVLT